MMTTSQLRKLFRGREMQPAVDNRVAIHQQLAPVGEKLRIVVLPFSVRLQSGIEEDAHGRRGERALLDPALLRALRPDCRAAAGWCAAGAAPRRRRPPAARSPTRLRRRSRGQERDANIHDRVFISSSWTSILPPEDRKLTNVNHVELPGLSRKLPDLALRVRLAETVPAVRHRKRAVRLHRQT